MHALAKPVTAVLRAGYAWSVRRDQPEAWIEVARMTGVVMHHLGPGVRPVTPVELIALLHEPLGDWLPVDDPALARLVVLDSADRLTADTYDIGCDYTVELLDPAAGWLPRWRTHRAEQVENAAFQRLVSGDDDTYTTGRRFLVEHPAGDREEILQRRIEFGVPPLVEYQEISADRQWRGERPPGLTPSMSRTSHHQPPSQQSCASVRWTPSTSWYPTIAVPGSPS
jgi:hypothetical protein